MGIKLYAIAGEPSGDLHQANLLSALKELLPDLSCRGLGGEKSQRAGLELYKHYHDVAYMGFLEVVKNYQTIKTIMEEVKQDLIAFQPDVVLLTDFSGFNMRIAKFAKERGLLVYYYIAPKVWAWNQKRVYKIKKYVDRLYSILPFELDFFRSYEVPVEYVGNPVLDAIEGSKVGSQDLKQKLAGQNQLIAILPGSRKQEVKAHLRIMARVREFFPQAVFVVAAVPHLSATFYDKLCEEHGLKKVTDQTYDLLRASDAAIVCSGTATLETALLDVPQVVGYRMSFITALVGKIVLKVPYVSLVNLILQKKAVPELLQYDFTAKNIAKHLRELLPGGSQREMQVNSYQELRELLGKESASKKAAIIIAEHLQKDILSKHGA